MRKKHAVQKALVASNTSYFSFSVTDWLLVVVLCVAIFLRVWKLESTMIFFADAGRDMLAAVQMIQTHKIPLLGIPSSVPQFKQGPLFVWFEAIIFLVFGPQPLAVGYAVAVLNCLSIVFFFLLLKKHTNSHVALLATLLLATSPLAVAHSRMPYHITPIISFLLLYLWNIDRLIEQKSRAVLGAVLSFSLLFQFELALFPLLLLIPLSLWKTKHWKKTFLWEISLGFAIGLLPQLIYDTTHQFSQLGGFIFWVAKNIARYFLPGTSHAFSISQFVDTAKIFFFYFSRIFSLNSTVLGAVFLGLVLLSLWSIVRTKKADLFLYEVGMSVLLLLLALVIHGTPSEAYFPPIIVLCCMSIGIGLFHWKQLAKYLVVLLIMSTALINSRAIMHNHFFVLPANSKFHYGPSYKEQLQVMRFIQRDTNTKPYTLRSSDPEARFESYLDNYRMIGLSLNNSTQQSQSETPTAVYFINSKNSELVEYQGAKTVLFDHVSVIVVPDIP